LAHVTRILYKKILAAKITTARIFINAEGSVFPIETAKATIAEILTCDPEWYYHKILERVKATCFSPHRYDTPNYKLGIFKVAEHFQVKNQICSISAH